MKKRKRGRRTDIVTSFSATLEANSGSFSSAGLEERYVRSWSLDRLRWTSEFWSLEISNLHTTRTEVGVQLI